MKRLLGTLTWMALLVSGCSSSPNSEIDLPIVETGIEVGSWALVASGEFLMGQQNHEILVNNNYEIMITDVTNAQYADYLNKALSAGTISIVQDRVVGYYPGDEFHGADHEVEITAGDKLHVSLVEDGLRQVFDGKIFTVKPGYENHPMVLVSWFGSKAYCEFYQWRLPTEVEWEKAARGIDGRPFPWGNHAQENNANYYKSHDLFEELNPGQGNTTPVGFYNGQTYNGYKTLNSTSPYGLYDMAGNVWQWTGDVYDDQHYRYMRGGSKNNYAYNLRVWTRNSAGPSYYSPSVGFRCARDVD